MAVPLSSAQVSTLQALLALEEQVIFLCQQLASVQQVYNAANPNGVKQAISIVPNYDGGSISVQIALPLESGSVALFPTASVGTAF